LEASVEAYYKKVANQVDYKDGADFLTNEIPETEIIQGELDAWGIEFMLKKKIGKFNGWINYTYSRANILAKDEETGESNNFGDSYPANHDKPHAFNLVMNYKLTKRLSFSGNVVYTSGRPVTSPTAIYYQNGIEVTHFSARNEYRLPDYFRIDFWAAKRSSIRKLSIIKTCWWLTG
jgi:predicted porin